MSDFHWDLSKAPSNAPSSVSTLLYLLPPLISPPPLCLSVCLCLSLSLCLTVCLSLCLPLSLSLWKSSVIMSAYPPHHIFVILNVSYKFIVWHSQKYFVAACRYAFINKNCLNQRGQGNSYVTLLYGISELLFHSPFLPPLIFFIFFGLFVGWLFLFLLLLLFSSFFFNT